MTRAVDMPAPCAYSTPQACAMNVVVRNGEDCSGHAATPASRESMTAVADNLKISMSSVVMKNSTHWVRFDKSAVTVHPLKKVALASITKDSPGVVGEWIRAHVPRRWPRAMPQSAFLQRGVVHPIVAVDNVAPFCRSINNMGNTWAKPSAFSIDSLPASPFLSHPSPLASMLSMFCRAVSLCDGQCIAHNQS